MNKNKNHCVCEGGTTLIFTCSGAADVGELADKAGREMTRKGIGKMYCLAGIGGRISGIVETTKSADRLLAIDGCPVSCVKKMLKNNGFKQFHYLELSSMDFEKGKSPVTDEAVQKIIKNVSELLGG